MAKKKNRANRNPAGRNPATEDGRKKQAGTRGGQAAEPKNWFARLPGWWQAAVVLGAAAGTVGAHFLLWGLVIPEVGSVVGRVPVVSTVVGWLFAGGAFAALGVLGINHDSAGPEPRRRLKTVAWIWSLVGVACIPTGYADDVVLPTDFWAGVYAGSYGVTAVPLAAFVVALLWALVVKVLRIENGDPTNKSLGWVLVGYSALLLVWGSSLLRM